MGHRPLRPDNIFDKVPSAKAAIDSLTQEDQKPTCEKCKSQKVGRKFLTHGVFFHCESCGYMAPCGMSTAPVDYSNSPVPQHLEHTEVPVDDYPEHDYATAGMRDPSKCFDVE